METSAILRGVRLSAQKGRLVADQIRGLPVDKALNILTSARRRAPCIIKKVLDVGDRQCRAQRRRRCRRAQGQDHLGRQGGMLRRFTRARKRPWQRILKQTCHIHVTVGDGK